MKTGRWLFVPIAVLTAALLAACGAPTSTTAPSAPRAEILAVAPRPLATAAGGRRTQTDQRTGLVRAVLQPDMGSLRVALPGLPGGAEARVGITDHVGVTRWVRSAGTLTDLPAGDYTVAAAGVRHAGAVYLPQLAVQRVRVGGGAEGDGAEGGGAADRDTQSDGAARVEGDGAAGDRAEGSGVAADVVVEYSAPAAPIYATAPVVPDCAAGELSTTAQDRALASLNFVRALSGLPPVAHDDSARAGVQEASLMFAANVQISHAPAQSWTCFSEAGATAAGNSNIAIVASTAPIDAVPEDFITQWANDLDVPGLGHRRWMLDPFLARTAFGMVEGASQRGDFSHAAGAALDVSGEADMGVADTGTAELALPFVAYPRGDFPTELFSNDWFMSFAVLADPAARFGNDDEVDYRNAAVAVSGPDGASLDVTDVSADHRAQGLPNQLKWRVAGLQDGVAYEVEVSGVLVNGTREDFRYRVRLR